MRKIILIVLAIMLIACPSIARDEQRQIVAVNDGSAEGSRYESITTSASRLYGLVVIGGKANSSVAIFDSANDGTTGKTELVELRIAVINDTKTINFGDYGIKAEEGITVYSDNATAFIYYK